jgi:hypothetical protein
MRRRSWGELDANIQPVTGDEPARCRDYDGDWRIACGRRRKQDAQRVALVEMREAGDAVTLSETDFGSTLGQ